MQHTVTIALLRSLARMAVDGVPSNEAARRTGQSRHFVRDWAHSQNVRFQPIQNRGMPAWLLPEAARQAEAALRDMAAPPRPPALIDNATLLFGVAVCIAVLLAAAVS